VRVKDNRYDHQRAHAGGLNDVEEIIKARISPHASIKIKEIKCDNLDEYNERKKSSEKPAVGQWYLEIKTEQIGKIPGKGHQ
jgi:hypothetical protein